MFSFRRNVDGQPIYGIHCYLSDCNRFCVRYHDMDNGFNLRGWGIYSIVDCDNYSFWRDKLKELGLHGSQVSFSSRREAFSVLDFWFS